MNARVVDPALFHGGDPADPRPVLAGSRCAADGTVVFPGQESCPRCSGREVTAVALPGRGRLWSWTIQQFRPKAPFRQPGGDFVPYPVGYVDLGVVIVEARLQVAEPALLRIGMPMRIVWLPAWAEPDGDVLTYAFAPERELP
jgi:uncharacterized OB-fold protein